MLLGLQMKLKKDKKFDFSSIANSDLTRKWAHDAPNWCVSLERSLFKFNEILDRCHTETKRTWLSGLLRAKYPSTTNKSERMWIPLVFGTDPTSGLSDKESRDSRVIRWLAISRHCKLVPSAPRKFCNRTFSVYTKKVSYTNITKFIIIINCIPNFVCNFYKQFL